MNELMLAFVENASPIELCILAWIAYRTERIARAGRVRDRQLFNLDVRVNELWTLWGHLIESNRKEKEHEEQKPH